jgi:hypothetical protein
VRETVRPVPVVPSPKFHSYDEMGALASSAPVKEQMRPVQE